MNEKLLKAKTKLLELGYQDNKYLQDYLELLEQNLDTPRNSLCTQAHHAIPTKDFADDAKHYRVRGTGRQWHCCVNKAELDAANFRVNLLYSDHLCAHNLLALCRDLTAIQENYEEYCLRRRSNNSSRGGQFKVPMPKYITEEKILEKINYYSRLIEHAPDERTEHKHRTNLAHWRSKHRQFLEDPEKYSFTNKATTSQYIKNEQLHIIAKQKRVLKQTVSELHAVYTELRDKVANPAIGQHSVTFTDVEEARLAWKQAIKDYNIFCEEHKRKKEP